MVRWMLRRVRSPAPVTRTRRPGGPSFGPKRSVGAFGQNGSIGPGWEAARELFSRRNFRNADAISQLIRGSIAVVPEGQRNAFAFGSACNRPPLNADGSAAKATC